MSDTELSALARAAGLAREWTNAAGQPATVGPGPLRCILDALGLPCATPAQCRDSRRRLEDDSGKGMPPLLTGTAGEALALPLSSGLAGKRYVIDLEGGGRSEGRFASGPGPAVLPAPAHPGYHRLRAAEWETTLAVAPARCFGLADALAAAGAADSDGPGLAGAEPRLWGLGTQLYSLRRAGDGGIGDFTALAQLASRAAAHGAAALAISPVHAMFSACLDRYSPYSPSSRLFLNVLHIDPASVLGPHALATVLAGMGGDAAGRLAALEHDGLIDWPAAGALRLAVLRGLYERFGAQAAQDDFQAFRRAGGEALRDHARFEAMQAHRLARGESGDWHDWPPGWRDPGSAEVERFARQHADEVGFHEFLQWQAARGLAAAQRGARDAGMPVGLIMDLAVGADNGGSQAWSRQGALLSGLSVGAPPDLFNPRGQSWGLGAFSPHAMKARGFPAYIEMLRATFAYGGGIRIDHVLGLQRLWLVPHGASPEDGAYLHFPQDDLLRLVALESWRHQAVVIGEDLGTVPEGFEDVLGAAGLYGIRVLMFQREARRFLAPGEWPDHAVAASTTHDLPTLAGWWEERDIDWLERLGLFGQDRSAEQARRERAAERGALWRVMCSAGCARATARGKAPAAVPLEAMLEFLGATPSPLAMVQLEDALGLDQQPNLPGTVDQHPNWRRRLALPARDILESPAVRARLAALAGKRTQARRVR